MVPAIADHHLGVRQGHMDDEADASGSRAERKGKKRGPDHIVRALHRALLMPASLTDG